MSDPAPLPIATPPGWYPERATRRYRWWDGIQWAFYADSAEPAPSTVSTTTAAMKSHAAPYPAADRRPTNGIATASLVMGILGLFSFALIVPEALAVIFGILGLYDANRGSGVGKRAAVLGIVLGATVLLVLAVVRGVNGDF
jgi:hypothetical protein